MVGFIIGVIFYLFIALFIITLAAATFALWINRRDVFKSPFKKSLPILAVIVLWGFVYVFFVGAPHELKESDRTVEQIMIEHHPIWFDKRFPCYVVKIDKKEFTAGVQCGDYETTAAFYQVVDPLEKFGMKSPK